MIEPHPADTELLAEILAAARAIEIEPVEPLDDGEEPEPTDVDGMLHAAESGAAQARNETTAAGRRAEILRTAGWLLLALRETT